MLLLKLTPRGDGYYKKTPLFEMSPSAPKELKDMLRDAGFRPYMFKNLKTLETVYCLHNKETLEYIISEIDAIKVFQKETNPHATVTKT